MKSTKLRTGMGGISAGPAVRRNPTAPAAPQSHSEGIALVAVLMILGSLLVLAVGALALSRSNLWISQNIATATVARSQAEAGLDATIASIYRTFEADGQLPSSSEVIVPSTSLAGVSFDYTLQDVDIEGDFVSLSVLGRGPRNAEYVAEALVEFYGATASGPSPFEGAIVACEGLRLTSGGRIDAFDSRLVDAFGSPIGYRRDHPLREADILTVVPGAYIFLDGGVELYGSVSSTGTFEIVDGDVFGDITASGDTKLGTSKTVDGDITTTGNLTFTNTITVTGSVSSNENLKFTNGGLAQVYGDASSGFDMDFRSTGARVSGNATVGGSIYQNGPSVSGSVFNAAPVPNLPVPPQDCDPLGVQALNGSIKSQLTSVSANSIQTGYPNNSWVFRPSNIQRFDETWNIQAWRPVQDAAVVSIAGIDTFVLKTGTINANNGEIRISGGDVVMFVDGDFLGNSGGAKMVIDRDSSLTMYITGKVKIGSSFKIVDEFGVQISGAMADSSKPKLAIYSSHQGSALNQWNPANEAGVVVNGAGSAPISVYAPDTGVVVAGGGHLYGAVRGKEVSVSGGTGIHYDIALGSFTPGGPSTNAGTPSYRVISRR